MEKTQNRHASLGVLTKGWSAFSLKADDGIRTHDILVGNEVLLPLSYIRLFTIVV
jgi:hypothetical protein